MAKFEIVSKYQDAELTLPQRKTKYSAGYDFAVAEDIIVPPYNSCFEAIQEQVKQPYDMRIVNLEQLADITKRTYAKPTLVPTGIKCKMDVDEYLEISVRSSCPLKYWLILANGQGIIDRDYYNNEDNEGHIFFQIINLSPVPILLQKGDVIGQGIIHKYIITEDDKAVGERLGGFGSTDR